MLTIIIIAWPSKNKM